MKKSFLFFLLTLSIFLLNSVLFSQSKSHFKITGQVIDASNGNPLNFANVFLANTTLGDATDELGNYIITEIPPGSYELLRQ